MAPARRCSGAASLSHRTEGSGERRWGHPCLALPPWIRHGGWAACRGWLTLPKRMHAHTDGHTHTHICTCVWSSPALSVRRGKAWSCPQSKVGGQLPGFPVWRGRHDLVLRSPSCFFQAFSLRGSTWPSSRGPSQRQKPGEKLQSQIPWQAQWAPYICHFSCHQELNQEGFLEECGVEVQSEASSVGFQEIYHHIHKLSPRGRPDVPQGVAKPPMPGNASDPSPLHSPQRDPSHKG